MHLHTCMYTYTGAHSLTVLVLPVIFIFASQLRTLPLVGSIGLTFLSKVPPNPQHRIRK